MASTLVVYLQIGEDESDWGKILAESSVLEKHPIFQRYQIELILLLLPRVIFTDD
ncbi:hypothetical protein [Vibrio aquimaris]|uniref:hypothetical protein n=1 Tax=Vibrio aquimaris TaxID=2587862 RepID=UPI00156221A9|nr:hypothetical protein [Vibrio aquimaris]